MKLEGVAKEMFEACGTTSVNGFCSVCGKSYWVWDDRNTTADDDFAAHLEEVGGADQHWTDYLMGVHNGSNPAG